MKHNSGMEQIGNGPEDSTKPLSCGFVGLVGRPNAGKSTLLNRLVGEELSIVTDTPQTTRNRILGIYNDDRCQLIFLDTPGIHRPLHRMNRRMMALAIDALGSTDLALLLIDASVPFGKGDEFVVDLVRKHCRQPVILLLNKIDLLEKARLLPLIELYRCQYDFLHTIPVSALTGENMTALQDTITEALPAGPRLYPVDQLTDQPERTLAAEIIRQFVIANTRAELPFVTAVEIGQFEEPSPPDSVLRISAVIYVERSTQKSILIGKGGRMLKKIGSEARQALEKRLAARVFLQLWVKIKAGWREDGDLLERLGLPRS